MTPIAVSLKPDCPVYTNVRPWTRGWIVGFESMADGRMGAIVQTEHNEFEMVSLCCLVACQAPISTEKPQHA